MSKYTTGEIAKLCGVTVRTVQYYDTDGTPVKVVFTRKDNGIIMVIPQLIYTEFRIVSH